jgi:hypothetical protein
MMGKEEPTVTIKTMYDIPGQSKYISDITGYQEWREKRRSHIIYAWTHSPHILRHFFCRSLPFILPRGGPPRGKNDDWSRNSVNILHPASISLHISPLLVFNKKKAKTPYQLSRGPGDDPSLVHSFDFLDLPPTIRDFGQHGRWFIQQSDATSQR